MFLAHVDWGAAIRARRSFPPARHTPSVRCTSDVPAARISEWVIGLQETVALSAATFDTLKLSETLREAGMPEVQAKALSQALQETLSAFVTKRDLRDAVDELRADFRFEMQSLRGDVKADLQTVRGELQSIRADMREIEPRLTIRVGSIVVVALGAFTALSKWIG